MLLPVLLAIDPISWLFGDPPNFAQAGNGSVLSVVSRADGRGAKAGALVDLYYPHYAEDRLWESYVGIATGGRFAWAHDLRLVGQRLVPDSGLIESHFSGPGFSLFIGDLVRPASDVHVRHVTIGNTGDKPLEALSATLHAQFALGNDPMRFDAVAHALIQEGGAGAAVLAADRPATSWQSGHSWLPPGPTGAFDVGLDPLAPGASASLTCAIGLGPSAEKAKTEAAVALAAGWEALVAEDRERWAAWLGRARLPAALPVEVRAVARRALVTLGQQQTRGGGIMAAPTGVSPPYRFVWPRDSAFVATSLLDAGYAQEAARVFEFLETVQAADGAWAINYYPDGSRPFWDIGPFGNEHDQAGVFPWGVARVHRATGDAAWLAARWPAVRKACEFMLRVQRADGLLGTCRELWELDTDGTWTFSNAAAVAGLRAGAAIAERQGFPQEAARYRAAAERMRTAMERLLVAHGRFAQGLGPEGLDWDVEAANLALGSSWFEVFDDRDPRLEKTADAIEGELKSAWGGIRRYTGDAYYGGQPWPITTGWLALYRLATGDRPAAMRMLDVMTRYAQQTETLMLGEQFDEAHNRWTSAFPLSWSEATYLSLALRLY